MTDPLIESMNRWLDGNISAAKMYGELGLQRHQGDALIGAIWHCWNDRLTALDNSLKARMERADKDFNDAKEANDQINMAAEAALRRAFQEARNDLRKHALSCIDRTSAGV